MNISHKPMQPPPDTVAIPPGETRHWMLWDGECGLCRRVSKWVGRKDEKQRFHITPYQEAPSPPMTPEIYAACERAVHVVTNDGQVLRAGRATLFILEQIGYRAIARVLGIPPFLWAVELGYKVVAANRNFFSRFLFTKE